MNTGKIILATLTIFVAGLVTGALLVWHSDRLRVPQRPPVARDARPPQQFSAGGQRIELLRRMQRELDLTPEQHEKTDKILKASQERTREIMKPVAPQLHAEVQRTLESFREVLTPEQRVRLDDLLKKQHARDPRRPLQRERAPGTTGTTIQTNTQ